MIEETNSSHRATGLSMLILEIRNMLRRENRNRPNEKSGEGYVFGKLITKISLVRYVVLWSSILWSEKEGERV